MVVTDPFFWAFLAAFAAVAGNAIQGSPVVGKNPYFGFIVVVTATFSRVVLVLPFVVQPRFGGGPVLWAIGGAIIALSLAIMTPLLAIKPLTRPDAAETLHTRGVFNLVRHPGYLANTLWGLGWAVMFGSTIGVLLTPVWAAVFWLHALIEEGRKLFGASMANPLPISRSSWASRPAISAPARSRSRPSWALPICCVTGRGRSRISRRPRARTSRRSIAFCEHSRRSACSTRTAKDASR